MHSDGPVRLCCMQRHWTIQCPDGKVMCELCFGRFAVEDLEVDPEDGRPWDVCKGCAQKEREALALRCVLCRKVAVGYATSSDGGLLCHDDSARDERGLTCYQRWVTYGERPSA